MIMETERTIHCNVVAGIIKTLERQNCASLAVLYRHLSVCRSRRARLQLYVRGLDPRMYRQRPSYSCEQCQAELPTFIDIELDHPAQAAITYPQLWWHLRLCRICAQTWPMHT